MAALVQGIASFQTPSVFTARDEFDQSAGNLNGKAAPIGGTWATNGDATDLAVSGSGTVTRTATASVTGRFAIPGVSALGAQVAQVDVMRSTGWTAGAEQGPVARYTDTSNFAYAVLTDGTSATEFRVYLATVVAGVATTLGAASVSLAVNSRYTLRLQVDAAGLAFVWYFAQGASSGAPIISARNSALATGGALATGKPGIRDYSVNACTRTYDNFLAFAPTPSADAAMFAGQSLEIRSDRCRREDSTGTLWTEPSSFEGSYPKIPPAGREGRACRTAILAVRGPQLAPGVWLDPAIDDISAKHYVTPRYLVVPEA